MSAKPAAERPRLLVITGLSGSGKSTAAKALEDLGYYCIDNLPLPLLRSFFGDPMAQVGERQRIAVVGDVRAAGFAEEMPRVLARIDRRRFDFALLFLEATEESLVRRFSETRRSHPLATGQRPLIEGIRRERELLAELRGSADLVFDTSDWSVHDVRREIYREFGDASTGALMTVSLLSFGFKHGLPQGSDLVLDVRFLANPHFVPGLAEKTGRDPEVHRYLESQPDYLELLQRLADLLLFLLPRFREENRSYLTLAVGCTGGRHRSVAVCERLAERLGAEGWTVRLDHRDIPRR